MLYITQLIHIIKGQEKTFEEFEKMAIPAISRYNGQLLLRVRPTDSSFIECNMEKPYEIHFVQFASRQDFENFMLDDERKKFLHLKERSIRASLVVQGTKI